MRITSFRVIPVARVLTIIYGALGPTYVPVSLLMGAKEIILPVGIIAPLIHFDLNLHMAAPTHFFTGVLSVLVAMVCYAVSGCLTGVAAVLVLNLVAMVNGGIEASVLVKESHQSDVQANLRC